MGKKVKILVCGSMGFLMSNFIRYLLYRTKDYSIVSFDIADNYSLSKKSYCHKNHSFYIGDIADLNFLKRLILIEGAPDIIINGVSTNTNQIDTIVKGAYNLKQFSIPTIQLAPFTNELDPFGFWKSASSLCNGVTIEMPNCYGFRQVGGIAKNIKSYLNGNELILDERKVPWAFAEDIASFIWYIIEKEYYNNYTKLSAPISGMASEKEIFDLAKQTIGIDIYKYIYKQNDDFCSSKYAQSNIGWISDENFNDSIVKTFTWYSSNKWALLPTT